MRLWAHSVPIRAQRTEGHRIGAGAPFSQLLRSPCGFGTEGPHVGTRQAPGEVAELSKTSQRVWALPGGLRKKKLHRLVQEHGGHPRATPT